MRKELDDDVLQGSVSKGNDDENEDGVMVLGKELDFGREGVLPSEKGLRGPFTVPKVPLVSRLMWELLYI